MPGFTSYRIVVDSAEHLEAGPYGTYSLQTPSGVLIRDVSTECIPFHAFVGRLNLFEASEVHIYELIEDFLLSL